MILAHKIALDPNDVQETYFRKAAGVARFAYHWARPWTNGNSSIMRGRRIFRCPSRRTPLCGVNSMR